MNVLITGADRGLGFGMTKLLLERGDTVLAGRFLPDWTELDGLKALYPGRLFFVTLDVGCDGSVKNAADEASRLIGTLDAIVNNAGVNGHGFDETEGVTNTEMMSAVYNVNAIGAVRVTERFLPLLRKGGRLCFVSSEAGSVSACTRETFHWYCMTKAALNMYVKILFNKLRKEGYVFRLYHPGGIKSYMYGRLGVSGSISIEDASKMAADFFFDREIDEDTLRLIDYRGEVYEF